MEILKPLSLKRILKGAPYGNKNAAKDKSGAAPSDDAEHLRDADLAPKTTTDKDKTFDGKPIEVHTVEHVKNMFKELESKGVQSEFTPEEFHSKTKGRVDPVKLLKAIFGEHEYNSGLMENTSIVSHEGGFGSEHLEGGISVGGQGQVHGSKVAWIERTLHPDMQTIDHTHFEMVEGNSNKGSAKELFRKSIPLYKSMGIKAISTHANCEAGAYAWLKFGFSADHIHHVVSMVGTGWANIIKHANADIPKEYRTPLSKQANAEMAALRDILSSKDPNMGLHLVSLPTPHLDAHFGHVYNKAKDERIPDHIPMTFIKTAMSGKHWFATHRFDSVDNTRQLNAYLTKG